LREKYYVGALQQFGYLGGLTAFALREKIGTMKTPLGRVEKTSRKFEIITFKDRYGTPCSLQQSSLADTEPPGSSAVWLGVDRQVVRHDGMFDEANQTRMHIDLKQAKALVAVLEQWIASGSFTE
jgi:hypothetical protein